MSELGQISVFDQFLGLLELQKGAELIGVGKALKDYRKRRLQGSILGMFLKKVSPGPFY